MKFLNHDINKGLLSLIIFFIVFFAVFSVYYEISLKKILSNKNKNDAQINEITVKAILERLNDSDRLKETALTGKALLGEMYNEISIQNEGLKKEKEALKEEITLLKSKIEYHQVKLEGPVAQFRLIQDKNQQIRLLEEEIEAICAAVRYKNVSVEGCD